ncbi:MAG: hypothetical protein K5874_05925 [Bacteroidaceae bacterium]|nr:hypothetical protein [Bacteroidaceae bacterium]
MKQKNLLFTVATVLCLGYNATLHAQHNELDANLAYSIANDATWQSIEGGHQLTWNNLGKKLALTKTTNTVTLKDNCNFGSYDAVTMHITYELDTELPDGYGLYDTKAELRNSINGQTIVNLRGIRTKSHERTMDLTIDPEIVGGLANIKKIFLQSLHSGDNGGALYVKDVTFDVPTIVASETSPQKFSLRTYTGNVYLFQNLPAGTFSNATRITLELSNVFDSHSGIAFQVIATLDGGGEANISPTEGNAKYQVANGSQDCYLNNVNKSQITGIYLKPLCENGFCTLDAISKVYNGNTEIRNSGVKTFNARSSQDHIVTNLFTSNQPTGTFNNAKQLRLNFNNFSERNTNGGRFRICAVLNDNSRPEVSTTYSSSDNNAGRSKTLNIPTNIDNSKIVNFTIEQLLTQGEINFTFTSDLINNDIHDNGDGFGTNAINSNKSPYITLYKGGIVKFDNIKDIDLENIKNFSDHQTLDVQENNAIFAWDQANSNFITFYIPNNFDDPIDFSGYKVAINTSAATREGYESRNNIRFRLESTDGEGPWVYLNGYGSHIIDIDSLFKNIYGNISIKNITGLTIAGEQDYEHPKGVISINGFKLLTDIALPNVYDDRFPLYSPTGYAANVNINAWENDNILEWEGPNANQIYLKWNDGTDIIDLTQYESITINHKEITTSPYRVIVYYGNGLDEYGNIDNKKIIKIDAGVSTTTINFAQLFGNDIERLKDVRCIAIAGEGQNGSVRIADIHLNRTLKGMGFIPYGPINGSDIKDFQQLISVIVNTNNKVSFVPEFLMNDNSIITANNEYTTTESGTAHFYINEMLTKEQISQVKNVRLKVVSHEDGSADFSRIYFTNYITLEWDKYHKALIDNTKLNFRPILEYKNSISWDSFYIPINPEDLSELKRISVEAEGDYQNFDAGVAFYDSYGNEVYVETINGEDSPFNFYSINANQLTDVARIKVFFKQNDHVNLKNITLYKSTPIYAEARQEYAVTDMDYYRADDNIYYNDTYHKQIADVIIGASTKVVFGEVGATYVGRDGDIQSYYIMDSNDNFLTVDQPADDKISDLINIHGTKTYEFEDGSYILETNTRPGGYADLSEYSELRIWKEYCTYETENNNEAPVRVFFVANPETLTGYLTVDSVGTNFPLLVTEHYCSVDLEQIKKVCGGKAYLIGIKGMKSSAAPTVDAISVYKTKASYVIGGDNINGANENNCITNALADINATYIDAQDVSTTEDYILPRNPENSNCLILTNNAHLIGQNVICDGKATTDINLNNANNFYTPIDIDMNGNTVSYEAEIIDQFSTLVLPFDTEVPDEDIMKVYTVVGKIDGTTPYVEARQLEPGSTLYGNTPVLLRVPAGQSTSHTFEGSSYIYATPFEIKNEGLVGTYTTQRTPGSGSGYRKYNPYVKEEEGDPSWGEPQLVPNRYVLQKQDGEFAFYSVNREEQGNMYKPIATPFKCWLASTNDLVNESASGEVSHAKASIRFIDFAPTGVNELKGNDNKQQAKKIYNLQGLKLNELQKGFNIVNGEKIYVK